MEKSLEDLVLPILPQFAIVNLLIAIFLAVVFLFSIAVSYFSGQLSVYNSYEMLAIYYGIPGVTQLVVSALIYLKDNKNTRKLILLAPFIGSILDFYTGVSIDALSDGYFSILNLLYVSTCGYNDFLYIADLLFLIVVIFRVYLLGNSSPQAVFYILAFFMVLLASLVFGRFVNILLQLQKISLIDEPAKFLDRFRSILKLDYISVFVKDKLFSSGYPKGKLREVKMEPIKISVSETNNPIKRFMFQISLEFLHHTFIKLWTEATEVERKKQIIGEFIKVEDLRDSYTRGHSQKVAHYACLIGKELGLSDDELKTLKKAALLHDIGKVVIPDSILLKPCGLTDEEFSIVKLHTEIGYFILSGITGFEEPAEVAMYHHERFDGSGYPKGLKGDEIPFPARIVAVADVFDALTSKRVYREAFTISEAVNILNRDRRLFDPDVLSVALRMLSKLEEIPRFSCKFPFSNELDVKRRLFSWQNILIGNCKELGGFRLFKLVFEKPITDYEAEGFIEFLSNRFSKLGCFRFLKMTELEFWLVDFSKASTESIEGVLSDALNRYKLPVKVLS